MQFYSIAFLFCFLPLFLAAYYIFPKHWRNRILILGSLIFYALCCGGSFWWLGIVVGLTLITYLAGQKVQGRGWLMAMCLVSMAALLVFFKLYQGGSCQPAGMSFYLFQMAAYLIDAYRGGIQPERELTSYSAKMLMFPKLLSGPLVEPKELQRQEAQWHHPSSYFHRGLENLILGLAMKVMIADRLGGLWAKAGVVGYESISTPFAWLALIAYCLQLYFDFFGYSLMAMGLGQMLGFQLPRNFDNPYASKTVAEFYRRWHMSLGAWFRAYVYFPLGGSRKGTGRTVLNLLLVWLLTGLWHGTGANYLLWAAILVFLIINEKIWLGKFMNRSRVVGHIYLVFVIVLSWVPFAVRGQTQMVMYFGRLFGFLGSALNSEDYLLWGREYIPYLLAGLALATPLPEKLWKRIRGSALSDCILFVLFWAAIYCIATAEQSPFMYFQY